MDGFLLKLVCVYVIMVVVVLADVSRRVGLLLVGWVLSEVEVVGFKERGRLFSSHVRWVGVSDT